MGMLSSVAAWFKGLDVSAGGDIPFSYGAWGGASPWPFLMPSTRLDYKAEAGDLTQNAIIMACVQWIGRTFPEAPLRVMRAKGATADAVPDHALTRLLAQPNPYYNGLLLWQATLASFNINGNAYWLKMRNDSQQVVQVWYEPHTTCRPYWPDDGSEFIAGYEVQRRGEWKKVRREDVVHFRNGLDPRNPRLGLSPLGSAFREVFTDNEAANFSASLLRNLGIPGVIVSPATDMATIADPEGLKNAMVSKFSGDKRGEPMVMQGPTKIDVLSFSPEQMNLEKLRNIPEERITALLGIPAIVAGLGSGLDHSTYANVREAREAAYHNNLLPTQRLLAAQLDTDLLPDLGDERREHVAFDTSKVQALADDQDALYKRLSIAYNAGWIKRSEARTIAGETELVSDAADEIYKTDLLALTAKIMESDPAGTLLGPDGAARGSGAGTAVPAGDDTTDTTGDVKPGKPAKDKTNA